MKICYFGIYNPEFSRNKIYIDALKVNGHSVISCQDNSSGFSKYFKLWSKHRKIKNDYDFMIVGYPGHIVVLLAKFLSKKPVIADALGSLYDAEINSHNPTFFKKIKSRLADWLMVKCADWILLESGEQKKFFEECYGKSDKYKVVYTGVSHKFEKYQNQNIENIDYQDKMFKVVFRGKLTPESGIMYILEAANMLSADRNVSFRIIGSGYFLEKVKAFIKERNLSNVELISKYLLDDDMILQMVDADILLGQFENNPRLNRTIPHKAFEAFALGIPYLTADAPAVREIVEDGVNAFLVPIADSVALSDKIKFLKNQSELLLSVAMRARQSFDEICSSKALAQKITEIMLQCPNAKN